MLGAGASIVGIGVGAASAVLSGGSILYNTMAIESPQLQTLAGTPGFATLYLNLQYVRTGILSSDYYILAPYAEDNAHNPMKIESSMVAIDNRGIAYSKNKIASNYELSINMLQLPALLKINPTGYFILEAIEYPDPDYPNYMSYNIIPYNSDGSRIDTSGVPARVFELDPCPPARPY